ncbi:putative sodium/proton-dependent alanine carrier protein YrbD [Arthrobacter sp. Hiyo4]|nr:putative sodium/proton-dependent alanine carrier protein YrbD [Arthrobacter sp. Hiyo4]
MSDSLADDIAELAPEMAKWTKTITVWETSQVLVCCATVRPPTMCGTNRTTHPHHPRSLWRDPTLMSDVLSAINGVIWSDWLVYLCLATGVYFSIRTRFMQVRHIKGMIQQLLRGEKSASGVSSFQALAMSLAGRVGTGNVAGVATAVAFGGPGALFWMWMVAFLGASTSFIECTLGQMYKTRDPLTGEYRGGPAYYLSRARAHTKGAGFFKVYGYVFAAVTVLACGVLMPGVQANSMATAINGAWTIPSWVVAVGSVILLAFVIIGGVKRIASVAGFVVPFMAAAYIILAMVVVFVNADQLPAILALVFRSAFGMDAALGAVIGLAVMWASSAASTRTRPAREPVPTPRPQPKSPTRPSRAWFRPSPSTLIPSSSAPPPGS